jgi:MATE family multidrug resistance protein
MRKFFADSREIYHLAWPVIIGQIGHIAMPVVDNLMVGRLGTTELAAAALANNLFILFLVFGFGVSMALSPLVAMATGSGQQRQAGEILPNGLLLGTILAMLMTFAVFILAELMPLFDQPPEVVELAQPYLRLLGLSSGPMLLFLAFKQYIEGYGMMRPAMLINLLANLINFFANYIFIFGHFGFPAMGLNGAGWSTLVTRALMALAIAAITIYSIDGGRHRVWLRWRHLHWQVVQRIMRLGFASGFQYFFEVSSFVLAVLMIGWLGEAPLASHQIAINLASISYMFAMGLSAATAILVGRSFGAKKFSHLQEQGNAGVILGAATMAIFAIVFLLFRFQLPSLYGAHPGVIAIAADLLIIAAFFQIFDGIQAVGIGVLRGMEDVRLPTAITLFAYWGVGLSTAYLFGIVAEFGVDGVWTGLSLGLASAALLLGWRFRQLIRLRLSL